MMECIWVCVSMIFHNCLWVLGRYIGVYVQVLFNHRAINNGHPLRSCFCQVRHAYKTLYKVVLLYRH